MSPGPLPLPTMGEILPSCRTSSALPFDVAFKLSEAARIHLNLPPGESKKRTAAIDAVVSSARIKHPHLFRS